MSSGAVLQGFIVDVAGNEDYLVVAQPVVQWEGKSFVGSAGGWNPETAIELAPNRENYITRVGSDDSRTVLEHGEVVWVAGSSLFIDLQRFAHTCGLAADMRTWNLADRGQRWITGSVRKLRTEMQGMSRFFEKKLHASLFDPLEKSHGEADQFHRLYLAFSTELTVDRCVNDGLYWYEQRSLDDFNRVADIAIAFDLFASVEAFSIEVTRRKEWLAAERLSDTALTGAAPHPHVLHSPAGEKTFLSTLIGDRILYEVDLGIPQHPPTFRKNNLPLWGTNWFKVVKNLEESVQADSMKGVRSEDVRTES